MVRSLAALAGSALVAVSVAPPAFASTPAFISGKVAGGSQATVLVYAWPSQSVVAHLKPGATVPTRLVESTRTDSAGNYRLAAPSAESLNSSASPDGDVNMDIIALSEAGMTSYSLIRNITGTASAPALTASRSVNLTPLAHTNVAGITPKDNVTKCQTTYRYTLGKAWDIVGQSYSQSRYINSYFNYTSGQSSSLGVGVSASGSFGTYKSSGTSNESSTASIGFPGQGGIKNAYYKSRFRLGKYLTFCTWTGGHSYERSARTTNFSGGAAISRPGSVPSIPRGNCDRYLNGSSFHLHRTHAVTWTNGFDASGLIGLDLSTSTGYSASAELVYTIHKNRAMVCGTGGDAGGPHPYQVVAK